MKIKVFGITFNNYEQLARCLDYKVTPGSLWNAVEKGNDYLEDYIVRRFKRLDVYKMNNLDEIHTKAFIRTLFLFDDSLDHYIGLDYTNTQKYNLMHEKFFSMKKRSK